MKKCFGLLLVLPLLCACSGAKISDEKASEIIHEFEVKLEQKKYFSYFESKTIEETKKTKTTTFYQVFFEQNFIHSYQVFEDSEIISNSRAYEEWSFIKDKMIYDVTTKDAESSPTGRIYQSCTYEKEFWEERMNSAFDEVIKTNYSYYSKVKDDLATKNDQTKITCRSKNNSSLISKVERFGSDGKVIRSKQYEFEDYLIKSVNDKDDFSVTTINFQYKVTTQEPNIPNF